MLWIKASITAWISAVVGFAGKAGMSTNSGSGDGEADGLGLAEGFGDGETEGEGLGEAEGLGDGETEGEGLGVVPPPPPPPPLGHIPSGSTVTATWLA